MLSASSGTPTSAGPGWAGSCEDGGFSKSFTGVAVTLTLAGARSPEDWWPGDDHWSVLLSLPPWCAAAAAGDRVTAGVVVVPLLLVLPGSRFSVCNVSCGVWLVLPAIVTMWSRGANTGSMYVVCRLRYECCKKKEQQKKKRKNW